MSALLSLFDVTAHYGKVQALFGVSLTVEAGQVVALMGRNGMGKTTTIRTACRMLGASGGEIRFDGTDIATAPSHKVAQMGLGLVPEGRRCFPNLTVAENLTVAARAGAWDMDRVVTLFPRLAERRDAFAATLSGGEQQMLAIGRALMTNPRLLVLDEATEGLAPVVRDEIWSAIRQLKGGDMAILLVDKSIKELARVADRAVVLERGRDVWSGAMADFGTQEADRFLGV